MLAFSASAQVIDLVKDRVPMTQLTGPWRFQTGDDRKWADPAFDDSGWSLVTTHKGWSGQAPHGGDPSVSFAALFR